MARNTINDYHRNFLIFYDSDGYVLIQPFSRFIRFGSDVNS
jgi:hypothetical protein